jgi:hypothetical protein
MLLVVSTCLLAGCSRHDVALDDTSGGLRLESEFDANTPADTFYLISVAGDSLPARYRGEAWEWDCPVTVNRDLLLLRDDSTVENHAVGQVNCAGEEPAPDVEDFRGLYHMNGDSLRIVSVEDGSEVETARAVLLGDTVILRDSLATVKFVRRGPTHQ